MKRTSTTTKALLGGVVLPLVLGLVGHAMGQTGPTWTELSPTGGTPGPHTGHTAVYDAANNRMTIFGGVNNPLPSCPSECLNDVWVLSNADGQGGQPAWTQLSPTGVPPAPRFNSTAVYDSGTNRMVMFGGSLDRDLSCFSSTNDVWLLSDANGLGTPAWTQLSPSGTLPDGR